VIGQAVEGSEPDNLFPMVDLWRWDGDREPAAYGPASDAVGALLSRVASLDWLGIERLGSVWDKGNHADTSQRDEQAAKAIRAAAIQSGRTEAVRAAFLDGQISVVAACNPVMGALEHWWNRYPEVPAMGAAAYLAAAMVVEDHLDAAVFTIARQPFDALERGFPQGLFGPNHDLVTAIIDAASALAPEQGHRIEQAWRRAPSGDTACFGYPGPLHRGRGIDGWLPKRKGRRHHAWITLMIAVPDSIRSERKLGWAQHSARPPASIHTPEVSAAVKAAVTASLLSDLVAQDLTEELTEAWRSKDGPVAPSLWWEHRPMSRWIFWRRS